MMDIRAPLVTASVTLLPEVNLPGRLLSQFSYRPHIVIGPTSQREAVIGPGNRLIEPYLGVQFCPGDDLLPGVITKAQFTLIYFHNAPDLYDTVVPWATFTIREGARIVGYGTVEERRDVRLAV